MHSPEFLREVSAAKDVAAPERNIIGVPELSSVYVKKAKEVLAILPRAPFEKIMESDAAELVKYAGNCFLYSKLIFANLLFDLSHSIGVDWTEVGEAMGRDSRIGMGHLSVVDSKGGRGAGGHCFIKDFAAFEDFYATKVKDAYGKSLLSSLSRKNIELLTKSKKDLDLLRGVYGKRKG
jgi:UDPglucose 6-dehydrogenase